MSHIKGQTGQGPPERPAEERMPVGQTERGEAGLRDA